MTSTNREVRPTLDGAQVAQLWSELTREVTLADGSILTLRPLRPDDREREAAFIDSLSPTSRYMRLMTPLRHLTPHLLNQLMDVDYRDRMAFVATAQQDGAEVIIGVARYARTGADNALELGITVTDAWQRRGVARELLYPLLTYARAQGFEKASSTVLPDNFPMLQLARASGARVSLNAGEALMQVEFPLADIVQGEASCTNVSSFPSTAVRLPNAESSKRSS